MSVLLVSVMRLVTLSTRRVLEPDRDGMELDGLEEEFGVMAEVGWSGEAGENWSL